MGAPGAPPQAAATAGPGPAGILGAGLRRDVHTASQPATAGIRGRCPRRHMAAGWPWREPCTKMGVPTGSRVAGCAGAGIATAFSDVSALPLRASHTGQEGAGAVRAGPVPMQTSGLAGTRRRLPARRHRTPGLRAHPAPREPGRGCSCGPPSLWGTGGARGSSSTAGEVSPARLLEKVWTERRGQEQPRPGPAHPPPVVLPGHPHGPGSRVPEPRRCPPPLPDRFIALKKRKL